MESRFSNFFLHVALRDFLNKSLNIEFCPRTPRLRFNVSADFFKNLWRSIRGREIVTRSKQCNVWCRTISIRTDLSTSTTWRRRRKKSFTRTSTYREYGLAFLLQMYFYDEQRRVLLLPGAGRSEWEVRFFRFVFKLYFLQKLNYIELYGKLTFLALVS